MHKTYEFGALKIKLCKKKIRLLNTAPSFSPQPPASVTVFTSISSTVPLTVINTELDVLTYTFNPTLSFLAVAPSSTVTPTLNINPSQTDCGKYSFTITVSDGSLSTTSGKVSLDIKS